MANVSSSNSLGERVPKLRFPDKKGNLFAEYTHNTIHDLFTRITQRNTKGITNVITNSAEQGLIPQRNFFDKDIAIDGNTSNYYVIKLGDFVYNPRKSNQAPYGPFNCYNYMDEGIVSPLYTCLRPKVKEYTDFLLWYFKSPVWHSYIYHNGSQGGARHDRVGMTTELMDGIPINLPEIDEQQKIVSFFNLLEQKINIQSKLVEFLKLYKRGVINAIYNQKICLKDKNGLSYPKWSKTTIGELFNERNERALGEEDLLAVTINNGVQKKGSIDGKDISSNDKSNYKRVLINDIAYNTMRMWQGASGVSRYCGIVSPAYTVITPKDTLSVDSDFYAYYFKLPSMVNMFEKYSQGLTSDTWNLKYQQLSYIFIFLPSLEEQKRIVSLLTYFDTCIKNANVSLNQMHKTKKYLLQKMFI